MTKDSARPRKSRPDFIACSAALFALVTLALPCIAGNDSSLVLGKPVKLGDGFGAIEGPAWAPSGALYFSSLGDGKIYRWSPNQGITLFRQLEGGCNGLRFDSDGNLLVCQPRARRVLRITPDGEEQVVADRHRGGRLNSPNDIWVAPDGGIYFTDPRYGKGNDVEQDGNYVFYVPARSKQPIPVITDLQKPNGIVGTADGRKLFVADPKAGKVYAYSIEADGTVAARRLAADTGSDGLAVDNRGNLYVTGKVIKVYSPEAKVIKQIEMPAGVSNLTFGGRERQTLLCTSRAGLFAIPMNVRDGSDSVSVIGASQ